MNIMIPVGRATVPENTNNFLEDYGDLRYTLRSIEKHLKNVKGVHLIFGEPHLPVWLDRFSVRIDYVSDIKRIEYKERNIYNKILRQFERTEEFLFMNDDHFLLKDFDSNNFPVYAERRSMKQIFQILRRGQYTQTISNTLEVLGDGALYYDVHCPIIYRLKEFLAAFEGIHTTRANGYCLKSIYGNRTPNMPILIDDFKIHGVDSYQSLKDKIDGRDFFSTSDNVFGPSLMKILEELYPNKSKFEL